MNLSISNNHLRFLSAHPQWMGLSWETRGMALQLMGMGNFEEHLGTLPHEDTLWTSCLGFPSGRATSPKTAQAYQQQHRAWTEHWKPELLGWFVLIDEAFLQTRPHYTPQIGRYWHPLVDLWLEEAEQVGGAGSGKKQPVKKIKKAGQILVAQSNEKTLERSPSGKNPLLKKGRKIKPVLLVETEWDFPVIRYNKSTLLSCWDDPISKEARSSLWTNATAALASGTDAKQQQIARQFLGKLIKDYGEREVAAAVAQLLVRSVPPADPKSFLKKQLSHSSLGGSPAVQKARMQRAKLPL